MRLLVAAHVGGGDVSDVGGLGCGGDGEVLVWRGEWFVCLKVPVCWRVLDVSGW